MATHRDPKGLVVSTLNKSLDEEVFPTPDGESPNESEKTSLRRVSDSIPLSAWLVCIVETSERFSYYCISGPLQNYIQNPYNSGLRPGVLGLGQATATSISYGFTFWMYLMPLLGAYVADAFLGRYRTICVGVGIYMCGILILFATSLPQSIENGAALGGTIAALFLIGTGAGSIKPNVGVLIFEQYTETRQKIKTLKSGERVIVDPQTTITNMYMIYYNVLCIGCLSGIPATYIALRLDYWVVFLLPFCVFWICILTLALGRKKYVHAPPKPVLGQAFRALGIAIRSGFNMDAAKQSNHMEDEGRSMKITWDDQFVDELKRALYACRVFIPLPIAWLCYLQASNNLVSQAGTMETHGLPNDILYNFTLLIEIVMIYVFRKGVYPLLRRWHVGIGPIRRMTAGFLCGTMGIAWAAIVQRIIYNAGPCYDAPLTCEASDGGTIPNRVHVMLQFPSYVLFALSEIMFAITSYEYAYTKSPKSMRSIVQAMNFLMVAIASALGIAVSRAAVDPGLIIMYACLAGVYFAVTCGFFLICRGYDKLEDQLFQVGVRQEQAEEADKQHDEAVTR